MSCACKIGGGPDGVCFECKSRRAFHARLKKLEDKAALDGFDLGNIVYVVLTLDREKEKGTAEASDYARGVADERARVVADLVKSADRASDDKMGPVKIVLLNAAIRFERCEHEEKP